VCPGFAPSYGAYEGRNPKIERMIFFEKDRGECIGWMSRQGGFEICSPIMCIRVSFCTAGVLTGEVFLVLYKRGKREEKGNKESTTQ
jgi:hypothetical protein